MKKIWIVGIMVVVVTILFVYGKKQGPTFVEQGIEFKNNNSVYKQETSNNNTVNKVELPKNAITKPVSSYSTLSNQKYGWGLKRNSEHKTPEIPSSIVSTLKKYNGIYVGNENEKVIYLTFDEGYENGFTGKILDTLKANNVKAAFFITGPYVKKNSDLVQRMIDEGHIIGNHTINHPSLPSLEPDKVEQEIVALDRMVYEKWKINMNFMRPPMGEYSERVLAQLKDLGHRAVFWSFAYDDYDTNNQKGTDYAYKMIMDNLHNGALYLLHAVSKDNTEVLDRVIKDIKAQGYEFRRLDKI